MNQSLFQNNNISACRLNCAGYVIATLCWYAPQFPFQRFLSHPLFGVINTWSRDMKKLFILLAAAALVSTTVGCANGPIRNLFRGSTCDTCQPPAAEPSFGFNYGAASTAPTGCQSGNCSGVASQSAPITNPSIGNAVGTSYMNDSYIQSDPYINNSNIGGATINPPVFDGYGGPSYGGTTVPPGSSGILPVPNGGY